MGKQHSRRHIRRHGEALTARNYEHGTEDEHGDAERAEAANSPYATRGRVEAATQPQAERNVGGTTLTYDVTVYLPDDDEALSGMNGVGDETPPSRIERDDYGTVYRVVRVEYQDNGVAAADAEVVST